MTSLEIAVIKTLSYAEVFNQVLSTEELARYLIGHKVNNLNDFKSVKLTGIRRVGDLWMFKKRQDVSHTKKNQKQITVNKLEHVKKYQLAFKIIPWIKFVGVTGSVAGGTPREKDDIDLLIITDARRLWLTRLLLILIFNVLGKRRKPLATASQVNNKFCLNMWLAMDNLLEGQQDIYAANEIAHIVPVLDREHTYHYYLQTNSWVAKLLPNFYSEAAAEVYTPQPSLVKNRLIDGVDSLCHKFQQRIMRQPTAETIEDARLAFHPHNYRTEILKKYTKNLAKFDLK